MSCKTYSVMQGEPQLGKVRECTYTITRDEIVEVIIGKFFEGMIESSSQTFEYGDTGVELEVGAYLTNEEIDMVNKWILKASSDLYPEMEDFIDNLIPKNVEIEYETQSYI